jgi:hypothetical protein
VAGLVSGEHTDRVLVSSYHYLEGPAIALAALGVIVLICRWVFATDRTAPAVRQSAQEKGDFGLLAPVTVVPTRDDAAMLRAVLSDAGIRATVTDAPGGFAVLVFSDDVARARALVRS